MGSIKNHLINIRFIILSLLILFFTIAGCTYAFFIISSLNTVDTNSARVYFNDYINSINNEDYDSINNCTYTIYDLEGTITYSNDSSKTIGTKEDLKTLSGLHEETKSNLVTYTAPFIKDNKQIGTIILHTNSSNINSNNYYIYIPLIILPVIILMCIYFLIKTLKRDIISPINEIHNSAVNILNGNLNESITYDYDGEIGSLCHDFENMRLSLEYGINNERELKEKEKLLLAYISHDLKTPIASISGYAEGIESGIVSNTDDIKEYASIILKKSLLLTKLIDDILIQSKSQLNQFTITMEECYAESYFSELISEIQNDIVSKGLNFNHSDIPNVLINIDKLRIKQVIQNLVNNSLKYTEKGGQISLNFELIDSYLLVSVIDNGSGIDSADLPMIFNEFYRGDKARNSNIEGSGLGLSIAKYIVEKHNGQIECDSVLNSYTNITFSLPY